MTSSFTRICAALPGVLLLLASYAAPAKPLSSEDCVKLVNEHAELAKLGIESKMDRNPASAGAELKAEELVNIERFLFIEGQIRFRCPEVKLEIPDPPRPVEIKAEKQEPEKPAGPSVPLPKRKPAPK